MFSIGVLKPQYSLQKNIKKINDLDHVGKENQHPQTTNILLHNQQIEETKTNIETIWKT